MEGFRKIEWAERYMKVLGKIREQFRKERPLEGFTVGMALHVEAKTAVLVRTLVDAGAEVAITGCNPMSTQDDVADALRESGIACYAKRGMDVEEYYEALRNVIRAEPDIVIDDGADLIFLLHGEMESYAEKVKGASEETTTGVIRLRAMEREGVLKFPVIAVNDAYTKYLFDNRYGTGQSAIDGVIRATNLLMAGKIVVVAGYGWCGRGIAMRARGMGASVVVTEVDEIRALEAVMDGFRVMRMEDAAKIGDIFITATGNRDIIREEHIRLMKDGAILANAGHFNVEIDIPALERMAKAKREARKYVTEYDLGDKRVYLLAEGRLVNLVAADGHPVEVMDMSFANQALAAKYIAENWQKLERKVYRLPEELDRMVARMKLESMGVEIDQLTEEQVRYLSDWRCGT
ncbi:MULTISPECIES: adenosylhomocysteinase [Archaeoglobus]|uniref:Adenosylhomocysteinase n=3 Tax=Archaeoglobus fulgidus TaxID=2234 RepID=SAHH_ARCFU|nr:MULTISPECIES: adenosylhomocysteinase [Archaeoglobus]O28279.1 RecName: Full=Adenosylhomocysteinase; AltName: Full=S-adenosyl-L-homocysteine hydrolase; Short=AdoHcyase [Archaeoglobus fulgidus DSM 4304]AAB89252.1 S-adenosylhomocysteinase hydrolase (ahcY-2) [Archaeoglobus fulgidus DSM 4304]AIG98990.1 adenosylhomocysteinase [Archaeoglobus fulgidus DSM 8774]KUJ93985.1 MAG: Adenosylhomocysteinase [Archaeoglobus fulgidus]KUK07015.1 MAG: Adenosylhomocysteinase [Archaeoglobus fulgidus]MDI3497562.1 a